MDEKKSNGSLVVVALLCLLIGGVGGYFITTNYLNKHDVSQEKEDNQTSEEKQNEIDTTGKIYIKRNGIMSLENVPSDLVGTYSNNAGGTFTINSDGTIKITESNGDGNDHNGQSIYDKINSSFQITYIPNGEGDIILEIYTKANNGWLPGTFRLGQKDNDGNYSFALFENTPSANAYEFVYTKK